MIYKLTVFLVVALLCMGASEVRSQEADDVAKKPYKLRKNQHVITYSPIVYIGYNYAYSFNPHFALGTGISLGANYFGFPKIPVVQIAKISLFYRNFIRDNTYLNIGLAESILYSESLYHLVGIETEIFYGWNQIKIGHGVHWGFVFEEWDDKESSVFIPYINFLMVQINLPKKW